jgi:hypothetical protein
MKDARKDVVVWGDDLKAGRLPKISPVSGQPTDTPRKFRFRTAPDWVWALIGVGILVGVGWIPGVVVLLAVSKKASGPVFLTASERRSILVKHVATWSLLAMALVGFALGFTVSTDYKVVPIALAFLATIGWLICVLAVVPRIRPKAVVRVLPSGATTVELKQVHPAFAQAANAMYRPVQANTPADPG